MAHFTAGTEYGIHCLLWLIDAGEQPLSSRDLADLQGISPSFVAKIFPKLEKAGIVAASEGVRGGYRLARPPAQISFLDVVDALEGDKRLFDCQDIRGRCAVFDGKPPAWSVSGVCAIHAALLRAESAMRDALAQESLASVAETFHRKAPARFAGDVQHWITLRIKGRAAPVARAAPAPGRRG
jgi:Rrf2 family protein